jgi:two-component system, NtrC family, response regulator HydG
MTAAETDLWYARFVSGVPGDVATVTSPKPRWSELSPRRFALEVVEGPDLGTRATIDAAHPGRFLVGQGPACDLRLVDPQVSRRHIALTVRGGILLLDDLSSTNGTFVNDVAVVEVLLRGGERVRLGSTVLVVSDDETVPPLLPRAARFGRVVGASPMMRALYPLCERLARADIPLLIEGETGTGKELLAESLHESSPRADRPFVVFDCTAVAPSLVESMLFGHERGAFTGAVAARRGVFEQADGGTLFIDEVGDLEPSLQPKLLRAIERSEVQRVGSERWIRVNVRVLSATRRDLDREVQEGRFRDDLFFRLAVARIELPPLRAREGDVEMLARYFWRRLGGQGELPSELLPRLRDHAFPGNVRQLHNMVSRRIALGDLDEDLSSPVAAPPATGLPPSAAPAEPSASAVDFMDAVLAEDLALVPARQRVTHEFERRYIERLLARYDGDSALAAAASGIARRYFQLLRARRR